jgi:hypothetical protein
MRTTYRASKVITLVVTCLGFFMVLLDTLMVNSAIEIENGVLLERVVQA